jgi:hypothetical protein
VSKRTLKLADIEGELKSLPDLEKEVESFTLAQPAIGEYSPEQLKKVQDGWKKRSFSIVHEVS